MKKGLFALVFFFSLYVFYAQGLFWFPGASKGKELVYLCQHAAQTLDPAQAQDYASLKVIANIYEGLVKFKPGTFEVEPGLATSWETSPDGLRWTFKLRPGVVFHDGAPFTAEAVKFSFDRQNKKTENFSLVYGMVDSVQVIDPLTVSFRLKFPYAPFLNNLALPYAAPVVSPAAPEKDRFGRVRPPAGTGPFLPARLEPGKEIILKANPAYWGKKPALERIVFRTEPDPGKRSLLLAGGKADVIDTTPENAPELAKKGIQILRAPGADVSYLGFYTNKKPFQHPLARQAACQAINQPQLLQELFGANALAANGPLPPGIPGYAAELRQLSGNPAQSRRLLAAAGYPNGLKITLIAYAGERPYNPAGGEKLARALARQLAGGGFQTSIRVYPWEEFKQALLKQDGDAFLYGWTGDNGDPDNFLYTLFSSAQIATGLNATHYHNQRVDTLLVTAQRTQDPALRARLYRDAQEQLLRDRPAFFLNHSLLPVAASPRVRNLTVHPGNFFSLLNVSK